VQKGYSLWGGSLVDSGSPENLKWDIAYTMAVHGVPPSLIHGMLDWSGFRGTSTGWPG